MENLPSRVEELERKTLRAFDAANSLLNQCNRTNPKEHPLLFALGALPTPDPIAINDAAWEFLDAARDLDQFESADMLELLIDLAPTRSLCWAGHSAHSAFEWVPRRVADVRGCIRQFLDGTDHDIDQVGQSDLAMVISVCPDVFARFFSSIGRTPVTEVLEMIDWEVALLESHFRQKLGVIGGLNPLEGATSARREPSVATRPATLLHGWKEILSSLKISCNETHKRRIRGLNELYAGPIIPAQNGGRPKVVESKLHDWWNRVEKEYAEKEQSQLDKRETLAESHPHVWPLRNSCRFLPPNR